MSRAAEAWAWGVVDRKTVPPRVSYLLIELALNHTAKGRNFIHLPALAKDYGKPLRLIELDAATLAKAGVVTFDRDGHSPGWATYTLNLPETAHDESQGD